VTAAGPPVLLLHGFLGAPEVFAPLGLPKKRVYAPLLLGHRGTELSPERDARSVEVLPEVTLAAPNPLWANWGLAHGGFQREVARLATWARDRGFERGTLCGYSLGARLALGLLRQHPEMFDRAVLISVHPGLERADARVARLQSDLEHCRMLETRGTAAFVAAWEGLPLLASQKALPQAAVEAQRRVRLAHSASGLVQSLLHCGLASMPDLRLPEPEVELTVLAGELDGKFAEVAAQLGTAWPRARVETIQDAGHNLVLERPRLVQAHLG
jgi:2-succinyl-6-hydroxy-2,4-cyclohexadiene-1-carboxylate synthase